MQLKTLGSKPATKEKPKVIGAFEDSLEVLQGVSIPTEEFTKAASTQLKGIEHDIWEQFLASKDKAEKHGGEHGDIFDSKAGEKKAAHKDAAIDYSREFRPLVESRIERQTNQEMQYQVKELLSEIKQLTKASKQLETQFKHVTGTQTPEKVGKYHLNFLEWLLLVVRQAREKVESSNTWLAAFKGKKSGKGYWDMFQKHGTSFGMSNERNVATQTG